MAPHKLAGAPIVVGVDGSDTSLAAVRLGARQAALHRRPLVLLHALESTFVAATSDRRMDGLPYSQRVLADALLAEAVAAAREIAPNNEIRADVATSTPAAALVRASDGAAAIVVGTHRHDRVSGLLGGSTAIQVATHAACPVLISRGQATTGGEITLGIDGSPRSESAIAFAFEAASLTGTPLHAVHAWHHPIARGPGDSLPLLYMDADVEAQESRLLAESISGWGEKYPDVDVRRSLVRGTAAHVLLDASTEASLLVVGARGLGGFAELLLGSVGLTLMRRSTCPIAIVRPGVSVA